MRYDEPLVAGLAIGIAIIALAVLMIANT